MHGVGVGCCVGAEVGVSVVGGGAVGSKVGVNGALVGDVDDGGGVAQEGASEAQSKSQHP